MKELRKALREATMETLKRLVDGTRQVPLDRAPMLDAAARAVDVLHATRPRRLVKLESAAEAPKPAEVNPNGEWALLFKSDKTYCTNLAYPYWSESWSSNAAFAMRFPTKLAAEEALSKSVADSWLELIQAVEAP